jgi:hypothetical protein
VKTIKFVFSFVLAFLFAVQSYANLSCANLFNQTQNQIQRVDIKKISESGDSPSEMLFHEMPLSENTDKALLEFLSMASYTRSVDIVKIKGKKHITKFDLGLDIGNGYTVEIRYLTDQRDETRYTAESATLISPTNRSEKIAPHLIDFNELKFKQKSFDLSDIFPANKQVKLSIPIEIKGPIVPQVEKMMAHLPFFTKQEIRSLVSAENIFKIKLLGHLRFTKNYLKEFAIKAPYKLITNTALSFTIAFTTGYSIKDYIVKQAIDTPTQSQAVESAWAKSSLQKIYTDSNSAVKNDLNKVIQNTKIVDGLNAKTVFNSNSHDTLWITETKIAGTSKAKTVLFVSHDNDQSNTQKFLALEINPEDYPALVQHLKTEGRYLRAN